MGKVYEFSDIANNRVPKPEDFIKAKKIVNDGISKLAEKGEVYGAKIFGSVAMGMPNERSDFDLLIITGRDSILVTLKMMFNNIFEKTNVGIEPLIVSKKFAELGFHSINRLLADNIGIIPVAENVVGKNPLNVLKPISLSLIQNHEEYLIQKIRRFKEGFFTYSEADKIKVLQRALEAPVNMGRETLQVFSYLGYSTGLKDINKKTVIDKFKKVFSGTSLMDGFDCLNGQDEAYTIFLKKTLGGFVRQKEYDDYVNDLSEKCVPEAINWASKISLMHLKLIEGNNKSQEGNVLLRRGKESLG